MSKIYVDGVVPAKLSRVSSELLCSLMVSENALPAHLFGFAKFTYNSDAWSYLLKNLYDGRY